MNPSSNLLRPDTNSTVQFQLSGWLFRPFSQYSRQCIEMVQKFLIHPVQSAIQNCFRPYLRLHPYGYCYVPFVCHRLMELLILQWSAGSESKPHSHGASINFTKVLSGRVLERKYHISGGKLRMVSERLVQPGQWTWTLPFEIHELVALDTCAETLHLYIPGRGA
jgi:hypothetical protein